MSATTGLEIILRIEIDVINDNAVGSFQVNSLTSCSGRKDKHLIIRAFLIK